MDVTSAFKTEVLRPLVAIVIPGAFAIAPYTVLLGYYVPGTFDFWDDHPSAVVAIIVVAAIAAGLVLDDIGSHIESRYWDEKLEKAKPGHKQRWKEYLALELKDEVIGQRYLRGRVEWLKFELSMAPALLSFIAGLTWLQCIYHFIRWPGFAGLAAFFLALAAFLLRESFVTACLLAETREIILTAMAKKNQP